MPRFESSTPSLKPPGKHSPDGFLFKELFASRERMRVYPFTTTSYDLAKAIFDEPEPLFTFSALWYILIRRVP
jgi:hypothetical protein